jgi:hypothetical protein
VNDDADHRLRGGRGLHRALALLAMLALLGAWAPTRARADGDPASDVLATETLFLPQDATVPRDQQAQLQATVAAAGRSGYPIRVALIASAGDLGSVTPLWRQPERYAQFLGEELSLIYRGQLLVIMPNGYGLYRTSGETRAEAAALANAGSPGAQLGAAALAAIQRVAAASGHTLAVTRASAPNTSSPTDPLPWIAFAIGAALVIVAWTASLRAKPLQIRHQTSHEQSP